MKIIITDRNEESYQNLISAEMSFTFPIETHILESINWDDMTIKLFDDFVAKWRKIAEDEEVEFILELNINDVHNEINDGLIGEIEEDGDELSNYTVDESQQISNAGDAVQYELNDSVYEIITWNGEAMEHEPGTKSISLVDHEDLIECKENGIHLNFCDDDGFCYNCGHQ